MRAVIIIQARMGSTRLPGKSLLEIEGKPLIWHVVERAKRSKNANEIILATTDDKKDDPIEKFCVENNVKCFRGNQEDVLDRYYQSAKGAKAEIIVRITGDSPLNDPHLIDKFIDELKNGGYDYVSNVQQPWMDGFDVEVFTFNALERSWKEASMESEREHVTPYIRNSGKFKVLYMKNDSRFANLQCSIDKIEDLEFIRQIYKRLLKKGLDHNFTYLDVIEILEKEPQLLEINKGGTINEWFYKAQKEDKKFK